MSAIFKQNMYSGLFDDLDPEWTPINLFESDVGKLSRYQLMNIKDIYQSDLAAGQCLFIPSSYWYQSETHATVAQGPNGPQSTVASLFVTFEFQSTSELQDMLIAALDGPLLDD